MAVAVAAVTYGSAVADAHPSLLFSASDEPALVARVQTGVPAAAYGGMYGGCPYYFMPEDVPVECQWWWWEGDSLWGKCLEETAFRYRLGEADLFGSAQYALSCAVGADPADFFATGSADWFGAYPVPVALAYDLLYDGLEPTERDATLAWLEQYGDLLFDYVEHGSVDALTSQSIAAYGGLGWIALAIRGESSHPDVATWLEIARERLATEAFRDAYNPGGAYDEGFGYSLYAAPIAIRFAEAYRRATGTDLLEGSNIEASPAWYVYGWLPEGQHAGYGAALNLAGPAYGAEELLLVGRTNDALGKWGWLQVHGASGVDALQRPLPLSDRLAIALYYPEEVPDLGEPVSEGYPPDRWFSDTHNPDDGQLGTEPGAGGVGVFRTGWGYDATAVLFKVSDEWQAHSHNDSSSFMLSAYGVAMASDPTASVLLDRRSDHNVVVVGDHDDGAAERTRYQGALAHVYSCPWAAYARADGRYPAGGFDPGEGGDPTDDTWTPVDRAERALAFVRRPRPYLIVADDVSLDGVTVAESRWLMQLGSTGYLLAGSGASWDPLRFEFPGGQQLLLSFLEPAAGLVAGVALHPHDSNHLQVTAALEPAVAGRFLALLVPLRSGVEEIPSVTPLVVTGGAAAEIAWSDGADTVLWRYGANRAVSGILSSDARLLLVRTVSGSVPTAWMAAEATTATAWGRGLLDTDGLVVSASLEGGTLEIASADEPRPRQIAVYGPTVLQASLNGTAVRFVRAGEYVLLPAPCEPDERCNGFDDDCDGLVDEDDAVDAPSWYLDDDEDGYGVTGGAIHACRPPAGHVPLAGDCDDGAPNVNPAAVEVCNDLVDNDCDGRIDGQDPTCEGQGQLVGTTGGCGCSLRRPPAGAATVVSWAALLGALVVRRRRAAPARRSGRGSASAPPNRRSAPAVAQVWQPALRTKMSSATSRSRASSVSSNLMQ